mgnify:FL=1|jgi:hypothetical protein
MKKVFLVIANYKDSKQEFFEKKISPINERYCDKHGFEYLFIKETPELFRENPTWWKFTILQEMLNKGELKDGDVFTHLDADMVIVKSDESYQTDKSFSYSIDNGNTHCMGNYSITINDWSRQLVKNILSEDLWQKMRNDPHWKEFREQAAWYTLSGVLHHSWDSFLEMPNKGFHSKKTENLNYSLSELGEHVEIRGPEWNTTLLQEEANDPVSQMLQKYNINKTQKKDTIIRHFAGRQPWNEEYIKMSDLS